MATIVKQGSLLKVWTPYNITFKELMKERIPYSDCKLRKEGQTWFYFVNAKYFQTVKDLAELHFDTVDVIHDTTTPSITRQRILIAYMGRCKGDDFQVAYANCMVNDSWSVRISEKVLRDFFENPQQSTRVESVTLYGLLGAKPSATLDDIKSAFRRAAMTWHPDKNSDPDAGEMFKKVKQAFDLLSDPLKRKKYDVGLKLMQAQERVEHNEPSWMGKVLNTSDYGYRSPANCGWVDADIETGLKQTITKIHNWEDDIQVIGGIKLVRVAYWVMQKSNGWDEKNKKGELITKWEKL